MRIDIWNKSFVAARNLSLYILNKALQGIKPKPKPTTQGKKPRAVFGKWIDCSFTGQAHGTTRPGSNSSYILGTMDAYGKGVEYLLASWTVKSSEP
jgi:hypothetical protein